MRFEIPVLAAVLARDLPFSSAAVDATERDLAQKAQHRKDAIESMSSQRDESPFQQKRAAKRQRRGRILREDQKNSFKEQLRQRLEERSVLKNRATENQDADSAIPRSAGRKHPYQGAPDLGILASTPTKKKRAGNLKKILSNLLSKDTKISQPPETGTLPDLGIFSSSLPKIPQVSTPSADSRNHRNLATEPPQTEFPIDPDSVTIPPELTLVFDPYIDPVLYTFNYYCAYIAEIDKIRDPETPSCALCEISDFGNPNNEGFDGAYNLEIDCPNISIETVKNYFSNLMEGVEELCSKDLCKTCTVDKENIRIDAQDCSMFHLGEQYGIEKVSNPFDDSTDRLVFAGEVYCAAVKVTDTLLGGETTCETCQVTSDPEGQGGHNLQMDCANADTSPYLIGKLSPFCTKGALSCECSVEEGDGGFAADIKNCEYTTGYSEEAYEAYYVQSMIRYGFENYFEPICKGAREKALFQDEGLCRACGRNSSDNFYSSFSFEVDCPLALSVSENGFGYYIKRAESLCSCPESFGVRCSTCEVNPWEATFNIRDCVGISEEEAIAASCINTTEGPLYKFIAAYTSSCNQGEPFNLQDSIGAPDCDCTYDKSKKTASFTCFYREDCKKEISSYCPENPLEFCQSYRTKGTLDAEGKVSIEQCSYLTGPDEFSYCVSYGSTEDSIVVAATDRDDGMQSNESPRCQMEVDGVTCTSCSFLYYFGDITREMDAGSILYNCNNTVIGSEGNLSTYKIVDDTVSYFIYQSLPCPGGCDLCGVGDINIDGSRTDFMTKRDGMFASDSWKDGGEVKCFEAHLEAMTRKEKSLSQEQCQAVRDSAREPCGCETLKPLLQESSSTPGKKLSLVSVTLLTLGVSFFHIFL